MLGLSPLQEVLVGVFGLLLIVTVAAWAVHRLSALSTLFYSTLFGLLILFSLFPGVLAATFEGQPGQTAAYLRFDFLFALFLVLAYAFVTREYEHHRTFSQLVRSQALSLAQPVLESQSKVPQGMTRVLILITARNEESTIGDVLAALPTRSGTLEFKTLVVDDGSSDATALIAKEAGAVTVSHGSSLGIGAPLTTGLLAALQLNGRYLIHMDADGQHNPDDLMHILAPLMEGRADMIIGSRFKDLRPSHLSKTRTIGIHAYTRLVNYLTGYSLTDTTSGYWGIRADRIHDVLFHAERNYAVEMMLRAAHNGVRIEEVPVVQLPRSGGHSQFHSVSLFLLYHPRALAQIISAYTRPNPQFPGLPRKTTASRPTPQSEGGAEARLLDPRVQGNVRSHPVDK